MRPERKALAATVLVLGALLLVLLITPATAHWLRLREFEWKVRSKMDPIKLQSWATDLLERFPPQHGFYLDLFGTNLPPGMADIKGYTHMVRIVMGEEQVPRVILFGSRGDPAILVGPTNFLSASSDTKLWKPGIYFSKPHQ